MKISGFSFVRNGIKLYYPVVESIKSILPICDEFVIAVGKGDEDDTTRESIIALNDPKIKIIDTIWEEKYFKKGIINALQTDIAKQACSGDWLFYLQADEVVHEKYLPIIQKRCEELLDREEVEGLLFRYKHFWGDYQHYHKAHGMQNKCRALNSLHWGRAKAENYYQQAPEYFDYGPLDRLAVFTGTHPKVMEERIKAMDWQDKLQYSGKPNPFREPHKHERFDNRVLSWIEHNLNGGEQIGTFRNYQLLRNL